MAEPGTLLSDLYGRYGAEIAEVLDKVRAFIASSGDSEISKAAEEFPLDEFCVLKFILSALRKKAAYKEVAYSNLMGTLRFRKEHRPLLENARASKELLTTWPSVFGGYLGSELVIVSYMGKLKVNEVMAKFETVDALVGHGLGGGEQIRLILDKRSRESGRLCKLLSVVDLNGITAAQSMNMKMMKALQILTKANETHIPQMSSKIVVVRPPGLISTVLAVSKRFLSKQSAEKLVVCKGSKESLKGKGVEACPFLSRFEHADQSIPEDIGGSLRSPSVTVEI